MSKTKAEKVFIQKAFNRFFIPSVLSSVGLAIGGLSDCLFVGSQIGAQGLAVIGFGAPVYALYSLISIGISTGTSIHYSAALSEGKKEEARDIFHNTLLFVFLIITLISVIGLLFLPQVLFLLGVPSQSSVYPLVQSYVTAQLGLAPIMFMQAPFYYFVHCDNNPKLAAFALVSANILDIILNYFFLIVFGIGIQGAVYSTGCAAILTISLCLIHILSRKTILKFEKFHIRFQHIIKGIVTGYAINAQYAYQFVVILIFNQMLMKTAGENSVACLDVVLCIAAIVIAVMEGTGLTIQPMIATFWGERNEKNIRGTFQYALLCGGILCLGIAIALCIFAPEYCAVFGLSQEVLNEGVLAIRIYMLCIPFKFMVTQMSYYYQSTAKEMPAYGLIFISDAFGLILFGTILGNFGIPAFWFCFLGSEALAFLALVLYTFYKKSILFIQFKEEVFSTFITSQNEDIAANVENIQEFAIAHGASVKQSYFLSVAVEEMCTAVFLHNEKRKTNIQLTLVCEDESNFVLHLRDDGKDAFNLFDIDTSLDSDTKVHENIAGMKLVKNKSKQFFYRQYSGFNTLVVKL